MYRRARLRNRVDETFQLPALDAALRIGRPSDAAGELREVVRELFVRTEETREGATILERSALDVPELYQLFFGQVRQRLFDRMTRYVTMRIHAGGFALADPVVAGRFIIETVTFFARHRHLDPAPTTFNDDIVRHSIVDLITRSLIHTSENGRRGPRGRPPIRPTRKARS
jgi:hypothetical protein